MSILKDLDPQYAKIHAQPSADRKLLIVAGASLLAIVGGYWWLSQIQATTVSQNQTPAESRSLSAPNTVVEESRKPGTSLAATIREDAQRVPDAEPRPTIPQGSQEIATGSVTDAEYRRQTQAPTVLAKARPNPVPGKKPEHRSAPPQSTAKNGKNQVPAGKRTNERDIDIITAIVR